GLPGASKSFGIRLTGPGEWTCAWLVAHASIGIAGANSKCEIESVPSCGMTPHSSVRASAERRVAVHGSHARPVHAPHNRPLRAVAQPLPHVVDLTLVALALCFDAVGPDVAHPSGDAEAIGLRLRRVPEAHALHGSVHDR